MRWESRNVFSIFRSLSFIFSVFIIGFFIRLYLVEMRQFPTADEIWGYLLTKADFKSIWFGTLGDVHAPFYFIFLRVVAIIFPLGLSMFSIRLVSVLFGLLGNLAVWRLGTIVLGNTRGLFVFYLSLFLPGFIWASIYGRYYSLLILLLTVSIIFFLKFLKSGDYKSLTILVLISTIGIYTHYYFFLLDICFLTYIFINIKNKIFLKKWLIALSIIVLFCLPLVLTFLSLPKPELSGRGYNEILKIPAILVTDVTSFEVLIYLFYESSPVTYLPVIFLLFGSSFFLLLYAVYSWQGRDKNLYLFIFFIPPIVLLAVSYIYKPLFALGSLIVFLPALLILIGKAIDFETRLRGLISALFLISVLLCIVFIFRSSMMYSVPRKDFEIIKNNLQAEDIIVNGHFYAYLMSRYYLSSNVSYGISDLEMSTVPAQKALGYKVADAEFIQNFRGRVWYLEPYYGETDEAKKIKSNLDQNFTLVRAETFVPEKKYKDNFTFFNVYLYVPKN